MRLDLKDIIHKPDARKTFQFQTCPVWNFMGGNPSPAPF